MNLAFANYACNLVLIGFAALRGARAAEDEALIALVDGLDEARLGVSVTYRRILGEGDQQTRCDHVLINLYNHQTHHRGQVHCMLTQAGVTPIDVHALYFLEEIGLS